MSSCGSVSANQQILMSHLYCQTRLRRHTHLSHTILINEFENSVFTRHNVQVVDVLSVVCKILRERNSFFQCELSPRIQYQLDEYLNINSADAFSVVAEDQYVCSNKALCPLRDEIILRLALSGPRSFSLTNIHTAHSSNPIIAMIDFTYDDHLSYTIVLICLVPISFLLTTKDGACGFAPLQKV